MALKFLASAAAAALVVLAAPAASAAPARGAPDSFADLAERLTPGGAKARTAQASGSALGAWSNILPSVTTAAGYTESKPDKAGSVRSLDVTTPTDTTTYFGNVTKQNFGSVSASVGMNVLNISAWSQKKEFDQRKTSAIHGESEARNNAVFNVKQQYFDLVKAHRLAYVARESEKLSRDEEARAEALFQVGSVARGDVLKARARRATTQLTRIQAENQVEIQRQRLKQVIGLELSTSLDVDPSVQDYQIVLPDSAAVIAQALHRQALSVDLPQSPGGDRPDPVPAADHRDVHGHQRGPDHPGAGPGRADQVHRHGPGARRHHDRPGAEHRPDDPPGGRLSFVMCSISGETIERISRPLLPFIIVEVLVLLIVSYWETLTLLIPRVLLGM